MIVRDVTHSHLSPFTLTQRARVHSGEHWELLEFLRAPQPTLADPSPSEDNNTPKEGPSIISLMQPLAEAARSFQRYGNQLGKMLIMCWLVWVGGSRGPRVVGGGGKRSVSQGLWYRQRASRVLQGAALSNRGPTAPWQSSNFAQ